jgi:hypothetical protein
VHCLIQASGPSTLVIKVQDLASLTQKLVTATIHRIIRYALSMVMSVFLWVAINADHTKGHFERIIGACVFFCRHVGRAGGGFAWGWQVGTSFRDREDVKQMAKINDAHECKLSTAVAGMTTSVDGDTKLTKKVFKIFSTSEKLQKAFEPFAQHPTMPKNAFAPSRGLNTRTGMHYSLELAKIICDAIKPERLRAMMVLESHGCFI